MKYDYIIVGSGLFGCVWANLCLKHNKKILILEKRDHPFGNCYTENINGINIHKYGPHIFHTSNDEIWHFINKFAKFNNFINRPKVNYKNNLYSFPINLFTLYQLWGVKSPTEALKQIEQARSNIKNPKNLEEYILSQVGEEIYYTFIYGYTKKQWNTEPKNLPASIIKRIPIRFSFDDNYFNDKYQGIPIGGYTNMMQNMVEDIEIILGIDYLDNRDFWNSQAKHVVYCGCIDKFFEYNYGKLDYRSLNFEHIPLPVSDFQGNAIINYTDESVPYTRIVEHKHFENTPTATTIISKEYPSDLSIDNEPYYPINDQKNNDMYIKYHELSKLNSQIIFGGRLAQYKYFDMHQIIASAIKKFNQINHVL